jgi:hypothetical protein
MICRGSRPVSRLYDREAARVHAALTPTRPGLLSRNLGNVILCISLRANRGQNSHFDAQEETNSHQNSHQQK